MPASLRQAYSSREQILIGELTYKLPRSQEQVVRVFVNSDEFILSSSQNVLSSSIG